MTYLAHDILVPVDGSAASKEAVLYARDLAEKLGARITLLHVCEGRGYSTAPCSMPSQEMIDEEEYDAGSLLKNYEQEFFNQGPKVETLIREGTAQHVITELANQGPYDLLVIGSQGKGPIRKFFVGSVALYTVAHAEIPVLVMHPYLPKK